MFEDRVDAGMLLAEEIMRKERSFEDAVVVGITRGGVVVASVVSRILGLPLVPLVVRKIGFPDQSELALGAIAPKDIIYWDTILIRQLGLEKSDLALLSEENFPEFREREKLLKSYGNLASVKKKSVFLIDDGVATGATVKAALLALKQYKAKEVILVVPVVAETIYNELAKAFDQIIPLSIAEEFHSVGQFYESFPQISDEDVIAALQERI